VGLNYRDHALESNMESQGLTIFSLLDFGDRTTPSNAATLGKPDYEAEMAVIIGRAGVTSPRTGGRNTCSATPISTMSARDFQMATTQWMMGKTFDTFAPMG
jgi:2-keto-4-pentenoate hydratase/2-oxohepta-3-ene-1,7-dioic acid hydratase in catechol pathway